MKSPPTIPTITGYDDKRHNDLHEQGYKFSVIADYKPAGNDPFCGMPDYSPVTCYFKTYEEAEQFPYCGKYPYNGERAIIEEVAYHQTIEEFMEEEAEKKRVKAEAKAKREAAKAEALGMAVEAYKEMKAEEAKRRRYAREIEALKEQIKALEEEIARKEAYLRG